MTLEEFRKEYPLLKTAFMLAGELLERTNPVYSGGVDIGPTFDELLALVLAYFETQVQIRGASDKRDIGIYYWRQQALNRLETAVQSTGQLGIEALPILGNPAHLDTENLRRFQWTGIVAVGKKSHLNKLPCHTALEQEFADFLDSANDVVCYLKNERLGFSITYYESGRPRQYYPDFIVVVRGNDGRETFWLVETKGEIRPNTALKQEAAQLWCEKMSDTVYGSWQYLFIQQRVFERIHSMGLRTFAQFVGRVAEISILG